MSSLRSEPGINRWTKGTLQTKLSYLPPMVEVSYWSNFGSQEQPWNRSKIAIDTKMPIRWDHEYDTNVAKFGEVAAPGWFRLSLAPDKFDFGPICLKS